MKLGDIVPKAYRNDGYSLGLAYPYIYGKRLTGKNGMVYPVWIIWERHIGDIVWIGDINDVVGEYVAMDKCYQLNGLDINKSDPQVISDMDSEP